MRGLFRAIMACFAIVFGTSVYALPAFENDVPPELIKQVSSDLQFIQDLHGTGRSPLQKEIFGQVSGKDYMHWFEDRIDSFGYDPTIGPGKNNMIAAIAYNDSVSGNANHMMVTDYFVRGDLPMIARLTVLFHEARHSEEKYGYWMHVNCPNPYVDEQGRDIKSIFSGLPVAGQPACDAEYSGAYGISVVMMNNISRFCQSCTDKVKMDADLYSRDQTYRMVKNSDRLYLKKDGMADAK